MKFPQVTPFGGFEIYEVLNGGTIYKVSVKDTITDQWVTVYEVDYESLKRLDVSRVFYVFYEVCSWTSLIRPSPLPPIRFYIVNISLVDLQFPFAAIQHCLILTS